MSQVTWLVGMAEDGAEQNNQLLVVVIDINPNQVRDTPSKTDTDLTSPSPHQLLLARQPGALSQLLNSVLTLMNSHLMLDPR